MFYAVAVQSMRATVNSAGVRQFVRNGIQVVDIFVETVQHFTDVDHVAATVSVRRSLKKIA